MNPPAFSVREAVLADLPALLAIKPFPGLHQDRFREAAAGDVRYLVVLAGEQVIGFGLLVFRRPASWSDHADYADHTDHTDHADHTHLPIMVDLQVHPEWQRLGAGSALITAMEAVARAAGVPALFVQVDPVGTPGAHQLYLRLGYILEQEAPYWKTWHFVDSDGVPHQGGFWCLDMAKPLPPVSRP